MFTKDDIKPGMIVETRDGNRYLKYRNGDFLPNLNDPYTGFRITNFNDTLLSLCSTDSDITKVYTTGDLVAVLNGNYDSLVLIWSRVNPEVEAMKDNIKDMESKLADMKENLRKMVDGQ